MNHLTIIRITGVLFVVAGLAILFNIFGAASSIEIIKDGPYKTYGGALIAVGLFDIFLLPYILTRY